MKQPVAVLAGLVLYAAIAHAQTAPAPDAVAERELAPLNMNVRVDVTVAEQGGGAPPLTKTTSVTVSHGKGGSVRSQGPVAPGDQFERARFSVDVRPWIEPGDKIRTQVTLEYGSPTSGARITTLKFEPVLTSGRRMVVSESADPASERKITVEVTATILK